MRAKSEGCIELNSVNIDVMTNDFTIGESKTVLPATLAIMRSCPMFSNVNGNLVKFLCTCCICRA